MTSESLVSSEAVTVDEEEEDTTRDFLPPDLAEYLKQAEDAMLAATDITSPAYVAPARHNYGSNSIISNNNTNMQAIRESYESEDVPNSTSRTPPVFPSTLEEEDSVLRKILGDPTNTTANNANTTPIGNSKNDHASKEMNHYQRQDRNLEAEFGAEEQTQPLQDSTLNLTDMMILNGNDSVVVPEDEEGVAIDEILTGESTVVESEIRKNGSHEYSDIAHATISPIQRLVKSNNNRKYESKDQKGENIKKLNISSNSSSVLLSPEEKKARATAVSARKKRMDEQLDKIKKRRESIGQSNQFTNTSAAKASSAVTADSSSKMPRARLLQSVGKISATATTPSAYHHEEDYMSTSARAVSRISASSRLLQGTHAAENPTVTTGTTSSGENRRLSVSRISSSSRLLQPTHSPSVISNNKSSTRDVGEGPVPRRVSSSVSSRLLRPTKASTEHRESARRESISKISGNSTPSTPTLTVPEAPKFSTSSRLGEKSFKSTNLRRDSLDPNPISRAFGSPTHAIVLPPRPPTACSTPRQLTIPKTPNFSTTKRHGKHRYSIGGGASVCSGMSDGELSPPLAEKVKKFDKSIMRSGKINPIPAKSEMKLTIPKPPKFVSRYSRDEISKSSSPTFAEVMASYSKSVRKSDNISTYEPTLTVPKSPNFSHITHRPRPKSSAELEEEMMENLKKKPFKARPVTSLIARPVSANSTSYLSRGLTKPEPFRLSTSRRQSSVNDLPPAPTKDDIELAKRFRARPMPNLQANPTLQSSTKPELTVPKAPRLSISNRKVENSDTKENLIARMKERVKQRTKSSNDVKPFRLLSEQRHEIYQQNLKETLRSQEKDEMNARNFKARSFSNKPPSFIPKLSGKITSPQPFNLECVSRHESYQQSMHEKMKQEEEEQRQLSKIKAKPMPASQSPYTPNLPSKSGRTLQFDSPSLSVEKRLEQRHEFDRLVREKEQQRVQAQKQEEQIKYQQEVGEMQRLRKLPITEGGMQFTARPVRQKLNMSETHA